MVVMASIPASRCLLLWSEACLVTHALSHFGVLAFRRFLCDINPAVFILLPQFEHDAHVMHMATKKNSMPSFAQIDRR